jgi:hypothetical protein
VGVAGNPFPAQGRPVLFEQRLGADDGWFHARRGLVSGFRRPI